MTELRESALRKLAMLPEEEQDAVAAQIIEMLQDQPRQEKLACDQDNCVGSHCQLTS